MSQARVQKSIVITIELSDKDYEQLLRRAKEAGFSDVQPYIESLIRSPPAQAAPQLEALEERLGRRLERLVQDLLNPFTQKVDDLARRLAQIEEAIEGLRAQAQQAPAQQRAAQARQAEREQAPSKAIERLRRQGVVFEEEVGWLRAPDKFFARLEKEGAVVLAFSDGRAAVDPDFWKKLVAEIEGTSLRDPKQAADKIAASLGDRAATLFNKLVKNNIAYYNDNERRWRVRPVARQRVEAAEEEEEEEGGEEEEEL